MSEAQFTGEALTSSMIAGSWFTVVGHLKRLAKYFLLRGKFEHKTVLRNEISKQKDHRSAIRTKINCT